GVIRGVTPPATAPATPSVRARKERIALQPGERPERPGQAQGHADAHYNLGNALSDQGRHKEAEAAFREALRLEPDHADAHTNLGVALYGQRRHEEAEAACREAIRLEPDLAQAHNNLGAALHSQGKFEEARKAFRRAAALYPDGSPARQRAQQAIQDVEREIELDALLADALAGKARPASPARRPSAAARVQQPSGGHYQYLQSQKPVSRGRGDSRRITFSSLYLPFSESASHWAIRCSGSAASHWLGFSPHCRATCAVSHTHACRSRSASPISSRR